MNYEYITENNLENRQRYQYTKYEGEKFLLSYLESRKKFLPLSNEQISIISHISKQKYISEALADKILQSFEVRKRIYGEYDERYKPLDENDYKNYQLYLDFADLMIGMYEKSFNLKYLNALLKVDDTLLSIYSLLNVEQRVMLGKILEKEIQYVKTLREKTNVEVDNSFTKDIVNPRSEEYTLTDVAIVCANTARTKAYLQVLGQARIKISKAYILNLNNRELIEEADSYTTNTEKAVFFDSKIPLLYTLREQGIPVEFIPSEDINSAETYKVLKQATEKYLIYSGFGGQILKPHLFQFGKKYIHTHAGKVPEFRGSTTVYYHMLTTGNTAASVMFLNEQLDEGDILLQCYFKFPKEERDIDLIYEPYTRAIALKEALIGYVEHGEWRNQKPQPKEGNTYYIIHPVLKHIAILALREMQGKCN